MRRDQSCIERRWRSIAGSSAIFYLSVTGFVGGPWDRGRRGSDIWWRNWWDCGGSGVRSPLIVIVKNFWRWKSSVVDLNVIDIAIPAIRSARYFSSNSYTIGICTYISRKRSWTGQNSTVFINFHRCTIIYRSYMIPSISWHSMCWN